jgi:hypothetical protein
VPSKPETSRQMNSDLLKHLQRRQRPCAREHGTYSTRHERVSPTAQLAAGRASRAQCGRRVRLFRKVRALEGLRIQAVDYRDIHNFTARPV